MNPTDVSVCIGDSVKLKANVQTAAQYDISWIIGNDTIETNNIDSIKTWLANKERKRIELLEKLE